MADRWIETTRWWLCALSGLLLVLSFAPFSNATCSWIALVPAWWAITRSEQVRRKPIRYGYFIGLLYFGGTFWWISNVTLIGTIALILYLAFYPGIWFLFVARLLGGVISVSSEEERTGRSRYLQGTNGQPLFQAIAAAALWVTLEWWRSWFLTGFNWNELGDSQAPSLIFRQLAAFGGVPLISFVLVTVNILWAEGILAVIETFQEKRGIRVSLPFAAALLIVAICFAMGWHHLLRHRGETLRADLSYACVQPNVPQIPPDADETPGNFENSEAHALQLQQQLSTLALVAKPDLLIWPEAIIDQGVFQDRPLNEAVHQIATTFDGYFLLGSQDFDQRKLYNCAYLFGPGWDRFQSYRKTKLVILGEYLPLGDAFPWLRKAVGIGIDFTPGPGPKKFVMQKPATTFSPLICFEDTLPEVADRAAQLHPDFFVTITNDGWYQGWTAQWGVHQHLAHAVFRCVEHDRPMIRCANNGVSCEINQDGTVVERFHDVSGKDVDIGGIFARKLEFYPAHVTCHEAWGDWIILISALISGMLGLRFFLSLCARSRES